jgi:hypothetical protein
VDSQLVFNQSIEKIDISETRAIYTLMDFKTMRNKGTRFYKLYIDDGNNLNFYNNSPSSGKIKVKPAITSRVNIRMSDSYGNKSEINFNILPAPVQSQVSHLATMTNDIFSDVSENILMVTSKPCADSTLKAMLYVAGKATPVQADYYNENRLVYLIDLRRTLPDSIVSCGKKIVFNYKRMVAPAASFKYSSETTEVEFPENALYDTLYLAESYRTAGQEEIFSIGDRTVPLNKSISVTLKPRRNYDPGQGYAVYRIAGKGQSFIGGEFADGKITFKTREFGDFSILQDKVSPTIKALAVDRNTARFKIRDNLSGIDRFEATINGEWILMHYDAKSATIRSEKLDKAIPFKGKFELVVVDNAGNKSVYTKNIM